MFRKNMSEAVAVLQKAIVKANINEALQATRGPTSSFLGASAGGLFARKTIVDSLQDVVKVGVNVNPSQYLTSTLRCSK
jgi:hypothetical protein